MNTGVEKEYKQARWFSSIRSKYDAGITNTFIITGNIGDYAIPGVMLMDYLKKELIEEVDMFVTYNFAEQGIYHKGMTQQKEDTRMTWSGMLATLRMVATEEQKRKGEHVKNLIVIEYPEFLIPHTDNGHMERDAQNRLIELHKLMNDPQFVYSDNILIFITESKSGMHPMFLNATSRTAIVNIEFPNEAERTETIDYLFKSSERSISQQITNKQLAHMTAGLSRVHLEDLFLVAEDSGVLEKTAVLARKEELIRKEFGEIIEIFDTEGYSLKDFSGQEHLKSYHREAVIQPMLEGNTSYVPKGLLYMGPPGTGKTYFSRCLAGEAGINFVEFKMSKILDKWVGNAEKNLEKAFNCFESLAPVGVFIDEMDQVLSRGGDEGNSVQRNIFGMFLSFLSEPTNRGKILWVGATNYPNKIDEALKRAGRFDKKMPFFPPNQLEREEVFRFHLNKTKISHSIHDYSSFANKTDGYTPAEIENIIVKTVELAHRRKIPLITEGLLEEAMGYISTQQNSRIQEMVDIALAECNDLEFLPKEYREKVKRKD